MEILDLNQCATEDCGNHCDSIELDPPEAPEDRTCCVCAGLDYDGSCEKCRVRIVERMQDSVDK